jgi:hypothetical protein
LNETSVALSLELYYGWTIKPSARKKSSYRPWCQTFKLKEIGFAPPRLLLWLKPIMPGIR